MARLSSSIITSSTEFRRNYAASKARIAEFEARQRAARWDRPARDVERLAKQGKLLPRQRLEALLDPGTPFLELSSLAANMAYDGESPGASSITGVGVISGREVMLHADDSSIKGGAWYPHTVKKIVRCLDIALENHLPVVHLCDSAGGFLPLQSALFPDKQMADASSATSRCSASRASSNSRWCSVTAPPAAPTFRPCPTTRSSCAAPVRCSSPGRRW